MKKNISIMVLAMGTAIAFTGCNTTSHVEVAQGVNFDNFRTFGWASDG